VCARAGETEPTTYHLQSSHRLVTIRFGVREEQAVGVTTMMTGLLATVAAMTMLAAVQAALPSLHRFEPNPVRPSECAHCGRRAEVHINREDTP